MPESHTSTSQWQGFEFRMRRRRADRCLLRASAALDADVPEIARQLLEEARALDPQHPELQEVTGRLLSASTLTTAAGDHSPADHLISREHVVLLAIALALIWAVGSIYSADVQMLLDHLLTTAGSATIYVLPSS